MQYTTKDWKNIEIKEFLTRKISREYTTLLLWDNKIWSDWQVQVSIKDSERANDYLITSMTWLTQNELDELNIDDYTNIFNLIELKKNPQKAQS